MNYHKSSPRCVLEVEVTTSTLEAWMLMGVAAARLELGKSETRAVFQKKEEVTLEVISVEAERVQRVVTILGAAGNRAEFRQVLRELKGDKSACGLVEVFMAAVTSPGAPSGVFVKSLEARSSNKHPARDCLSISIVAARRHLPEIFLQLLEDCGVVPSVGLLQGLSPLITCSVQIGLRSRSQLFTKLRPFSGRLRSLRGPSRAQPESWSTGRNGESARYLGVFKLLRPQHELPEEPLVSIVRASGEDWYVIVKPVVPEDKIFKDGFGRKGPQWGHSRVENQEVD